MGFGMLTASAQASCGAISCFIVIGSQQQVPQEGLVTMNLIYNYTPLRFGDGSAELTPHINQLRRRLTLDEHRMISSITQTATLDINYGVTDRFGLQFTLPYIMRNFSDFEEVGEANGGQGFRSRFNADAFGDLRVTAKYNVLPTLRSMLVLGFGVELPTGPTDQMSDPVDPNDPRVVQDSPLQIGRGNVGLVGSIYQTYELIPHRLNQFAFASYRHTFRNNDGYQFGDEYMLNVGLNYVVQPWLTLMSQINYRYLVHDNMNAILRQAQPPSAPGAPTVIDPIPRDRRVPNTGSTFTAFTPGFQINLGALINTSWASSSQLYFYSQIPVAKDFNGNLEQDTSFVVGLTKSFSVGGGASTVENK
jgi:hypothetical protein